MSLLTNLVSYWKLDGNSADSLALNNGTDTSITYGTSYGKINQGALFNGTSSYISLGTQSALSLQSNMSISVWINVNTLPASGSLNNILSKYSNQTNAGGYDLRLYNNSGTQVIEFIVSTGTAIASALYVYTLSLNTWYHLVATNDGTTSTLYLNGTSVATATIGNPGPSTNSTPNIGCLDLVGSFERFFNGDIDEVGVWSRALTSTEVTTLYNGGAGLSYPFSSPTNTSFLLNFV